MYSLGRSECEGLGAKAKKQSPKKGENLTTKDFVFRPKGPTYV